MPVKKRSLAAPFLFTAFLSPAFADNSPPKEKPPKKQKLPKAPNDKNVTRDPNGHCWYHEDVHCPEGATCNPPEPMEVECPPKK
jgi:hypothetical protein